MLRSGRAGIGTLLPVWSIHDAAGGYLGTGAGAHRPYPKAEPANVPVSDARLLHHELDAVDREAGSR
uniref:Putative secreted peptide n=1 Tax=Anopheles braziliensis TaxID=58242 RepID=A0A2M3ZVU5_9DIPT